MTLNLLQLSRAFNVFVASQFRVCARHSVDGANMRYHKPAYPFALKGAVAIIAPRTRDAPSRISMTSFPPMSRSLNNTTIVLNGLKGHIRATHTGNKSGSYTESPSLASKTNKNPLTQAKSSLDCVGKKCFSKDKLKIYRPRIVSSSATNLHADFKMQKMLKFLKDQKGRAEVTRKKNSESVQCFGDSAEVKTGTGQSHAKNMRTNDIIIKKDLDGLRRNIQLNKNSQLVKSSAKTQSKPVEEISLERSIQNEDLLKSFGNAAKDIKIWLDTVRKHLAKLEQAQRNAKAAENTKTSRPSDGKTLEQKLYKKVDTTEPSLSLPSTTSPHALKAPVDKSHKVLGYCKGGKKTKTASGIAKDLDEINQDITRLKRERNATKNSKRLPRDKPTGKPKETEELLEIRPTYIENIEQDIDAGISKKRNLANLGNSTAAVQVAQAASTVKLGHCVDDSQPPNSFILFEKISPQTVVNRPLTQEKSLTTDNVNGFVIVNTECEGNKAAPTVAGSTRGNGYVTTVRCESPGENGPSTTVRCGSPGKNGSATTVRCESPGENGPSTTVRCESPANLVRKSKEANFVLINDSFYRDQNELKASNAKNRADEIVVCKHEVTDLANQDTNIAFNAANEQMPPCMHICSIKEKTGLQQIANKNQSQRTGSLELSDKLSSPVKSAIIEEVRSPLVMVEGSRGGESESVGFGSQELQKRNKILAKKLENIGTSNSGTLSVVKRDKNGISGTDNQLKDCNRIQSSPGEGTEARLKHQLESILGIRSVEAQSTKSSTSAVDLRQNDEPHTLTCEAPAKFREQRETCSPKKVKMTAQERAESKINPLRSASSVKELKPDFCPNRKDKTLFNSECAKKCKSEPKLYVKPEELSKTCKQSSKQDGTRPHTPPLSSSINTASSHDLNLSSHKAQVSITTNHESQQKMQAKERKEANSDTSEQSALSNIDNTLPTANDTSPKLNKNIPLSELFRQMQQNQSVDATNSNRTARQYTNKEAIYTKRTPLNKELVRTLQENCSKDFQDKYQKFQRESHYNPYHQSNTNCLVAAPQDRNASADDKEESFDGQSASPSHTIQPSSPSSTNDLLPKKLDFYPRMGMTQRLLTASKKSEDAMESHKMPSLITFSDSSMTIDGQGGQGATELEDLPEVDQFEEWIQNNMPEIYKDNKGKSSLGNEIEGPSRSEKTGSLTLPGLDKSRTPSVYEGSDVDGPPSLKMAADELAYNNMTLGKRAVSDQLLDKGGYDTLGRTMSSITTLSKDSYRFNPRSPTDSATRKEPFPDVGKYRSSLPRYQRQSGPDILHANDQSDRTGTRNKDDEIPAVKISNKVDELSALDVLSPQPTGTDDALKIAMNPSLLASMDGFVTMNLVKESPSGIIKSTLKRSKSREHSEERKVSFSNRAPKEDSGQAKPVTGAPKEDSGHTKPVTGATSREVSDVFGSSVDHHSLEANLAGDKIHGESNLRQDLAAQRKRFEMEARIKLINDHSRQIRDYESVLFKYKDIIKQIKEGVRGVRGDKTDQPQTKSEF